MKSTAKKVLRAILALEFIIWLALGIYYLARFGIQELQYIVIVILMIINSFIFAFSAYISRKDTFLARLFIFFFLLTNAILSITDQVGFLDYFVLALNLIAIASLFLSIFPAGRSEKISRKE